MFQQGKLGSLLQRITTPYLAVGLMILVVTLLHYNTSVHIHQAHGIYRRLYYFPIIFAAFLGGWPAGLGTALLVCAAYLPHAFGWIGFDPAPTLEKVLEMVLYLAVGLITGILVSRENRTRRFLQETAMGLRSALDAKDRMEAELVRSARLATVGRLSAGLAHEIRNPLASIKGSAELLAEDFPPAHPKRKLLRVLIEEMGRLNNVLTRFLAFARPRTGQREQVDLAAEIERAADLVRNREELGEVHLVLHTDPPGPWTIRANRDQIRQLLLNLLLNGAQAAAPAGEVTVRLQNRSDHLVCLIEDDGPGFGEEALDHLGTPFFTTKEGGTGLGLAICQRIVEDHGGDLAAQNRERGGARVILELPRAAAIHP